MSLGRTTIRGILVGIIAMTLLCYVCAFAYWASAPEQNPSQPTNTPIDPNRATNTPLDPFVIATQTAAAATRNATSTSIFEQPTTRPGFTPIVPTSQIFPTFTPIPPNTSIPTNTVPPTLPPTSIPPTVPPTNTPEIIVPPSDTPTSP